MTSGAGRTLPPGDCQVWWVDLERVASLLPRLHALLDPAERDRCARYLLTEDRARYLVAHALVRLLLSAQLGVSPSQLRFDTRCHRCGRAHGKPRLSGDGPAFSISHAGGRVAVALTAGAPVGVDVGVLVGEPDLDHLILSALAPQERTALAALGPADRLTAFLTLWVRKEALLKATGDGLAVEPSAIVLTAPGAPPRVLAAQALGAQVHLHDLQPGIGHVACVAVVGGPEPRVTELDATTLLRDGF